MLTIYKCTHEGQFILDEVTNGAWIHAVNPDRSEIETLVGLGIPEDFITNPLDVDELSRSERDDEGQILIILRIPWFTGLKSDIPYKAIPLGIIITAKYIVTVCREETELLKPFKDFKVKSFSTAKRNRFLLQILLLTASKYLSNLKEINKAVDILEDKLQLSMQNREMLELLKYQKSLVYFTTALKTNELMLERLQRGQLFRMYPDDEDLLEDAITENQQAIEMVNISNNILSSMMDAFASIISNNLNVVMKFLTSVTIVLSIPTIITSFFGMNLLVPWQQHPAGPLIVIGISLLVILATVGIFAKRNWF